MRLSQRSLLVAFSIGLVVGCRAPSTALAQSPRKSVAAIEALALAGDVDGAFAEFDALASSAQSSGPGDRALLAFTRGWLHQLRGDSRLESEEQTEDFRRAADAYSKVLRNFPGHVAANLELARVRAKLDGPASAIKQLEEALAKTSGADPHARVPLYLLLGDLRLASAEPIRARAEYESAFRAADSSAGPERIAAAQGRIAATARLPEGAAEELLDLADELRRERLVELAADTFERAIGLLHPDESPLLARALVGWLDSLVERDAVDASSLERLPPVASWNVSYFASLDHLVRGDVKQFLETASWWRDRDHPERALAAAAALERIANRQIQRGDPIASQHTLEAALEVAPGHEAYREGGPLAGRPWVFLSVAQELASRYIESMNAEKIPPGSLADLAGRLGDIEARLRAEKGDVFRYPKPDLLALELYHTVLGSIYFAKKQYSDSSYTNATFQLSSAIRRAEERFQSGAAPFRPLPLLHERLAICYAETARQELARATFLRAACEYLDADDFRGAAAALERARGPDALQSPDFARVESVFEVRRAVASGTVDGGIDARALQALRRQVAEACTPETGLLLTARFLASQRFKALADLAELASRNGFRSLALSVQGAAISGWKDPVLASFEDVSRLERAARTLAAHITTTRPASLLAVLTRPPASDESARAAVWVLGVAADRAPVRVVVDESVQLAATVLSIAPFAEAQVAIPPDLRIDGTTIHVEKAFLDSPDGRQFLAALPEEIRARAKPAGESKENP